jgi:hypothetical protein
MSFDAFSSPGQPGNSLSDRCTILLFIPQSRETTLRAEPCRIIFTKYDSTSGDRISALDDQLNNFLTFLEQEFNKDKECAKILFNWSSAHGSVTSNHVAI